MKESKMRKGFLNIGGISAFVLFTLAGCTDKPISFKMFISDMEPFDSAFYLDSSSNGIKVIYYRDGDCLIYEKSKKQAPQNSSLKIINQYAHYTDKQFELSEDFKIITGKFDSKSSEYEMYDSLIGYTFGRALVRGDTLEAINVCSKDRNSDFYEGSKRVTFINLP